MRTQETEYFNQKTWKVETTLET